MRVEDVTETLDLAWAANGVDRVRVQRGRTSRATGVGVGVRSFGELTEEPPLGVG